MTSALYAALLGFMLIALSVNTVIKRRTFRVGIGDGENMGMTRCMRAHGNFTEYTPVFLILLILNEMMGLSPLWLHVFGVTFMAGRVMHAYSLLKGEIYEGHRLTAMPVWRIRGMIITYTCIGLLGIVLLIKHFFL